MMVASAASSVLIPPLAFAAFLEVPDTSQPERSVPVRTWKITSLGRSRPAADAAREVTKRWLLDGVDIRVGHRRCSRDCP